MSTYVVLIAAVEGRNFIRQPGVKTYIQCRFNQEILTTDLVPLTGTPIWDTELVWELDPKVLSFLKSQRVPIKVICYSVDTQNKRETLGYVMLDLRSAASDTFPTPECWYTLVTTKYTGSPYRPELKIGFAVGPKENFEQNDEDISSKNTPFFSNPSHKLSLPHSSPTKFGNAVMNDITGLPFTISVHFVEEGYFRIGKPSNDFYALSITISFAENLDLLVTHASASSISKAKPTSNVTDLCQYYFELSFLVDTIQTETFDCLQPANFPAEKLTVLFRSSLSDLKQFLYEYDEMIIRLCQVGLVGNSKKKVIGLIKLPLRPLIESKPDIIPPTEEQKIARQQKPVHHVLEQNYPVFSQKDELITSSQGKMPSVGISMQVSRDDQSFISENAVIESQVNLSSLKNTDDVLVKNNEIVASNNNDDEDLEINGNNESIGVDRMEKETESATVKAEASKLSEEFHHVIPSSANIFESPHESVHHSRSKLAEESKQTASTEGDSEEKVSKEPLTASSLFKSLQEKSKFLKYVSPVHSNPSQSAPAIQSTANSGIANESVLRNNEEHLWHQYRFSIDMKCIREVQLKSANIFVRYLYPFFGSQSPFISHPPVSVSKSLTSTQQFVFKNGFSANEFVMSFKQLKMLLQEQPVLIEVWNKSETSKDELLGHCSLRLDHVLQVKKSSYIDEKSGKSIGIQTVLVNLPVLSIEKIDPSEHIPAQEKTRSLGTLLKKSSGVICHLDVILSLENFGLVQDLNQSIYSSKTPGMIHHHGETNDDCDSSTLENRQRNVPPISKENKNDSVYLSKTNLDPASSVPLTTNDEHQKQSEAAPSKSTHFDIHETLEYKKVLELELWKRQEQMKFDEQLKQKEEDVMKELAQVYKKRDAERQTELLSKIEELDKLQQNVSKITMVLDEREHQMNEKQGEWNRRKEELERQYKQMMEDVRDQNKKIQEECMHKVSVEKQKRVDAEKAKLAEQQEKETLVVKIRSLEKELQEHKNSEVVTSHVQLKADLNKIKEDNERLEKTVLQLKNRKEAYKLNYVNVLKKFKSLRKELSTASQSHPFPSHLNPDDRASSLKEKYVFNDNSKYNDQLQSIVQNEFMEVKKDKALLQSIHLELNQLKQSVYQTLTTPNQSPEKQKKMIGFSPLRRSIPEPPEEFGLENMDPLKLSEIERLIKERDALISAGAYTYEDRIVKDLNIRIRELLKGTVSV